MGRRAVPSALRFLCFLLGLLLLATRVRRKPCGRLAIVQGIGYPNPNRSHFESMAIWHSARFDPEERNGLGWLGRALDDQRRPEVRRPDSVFVGGAHLPAALRGRRCVASTLTRPEDFLIAPEVEVPPGADAPPQEDLAAFVRRATLDACTTADRMAEVLGSREDGAGYPATALASDLRLMARRSAEKHWRPARVRYIGQNPQQYPPNVRGRIFLAHALLERPP
jgi:hypothetical protein